MCIRDSIRRLGSLFLCVPIDGRRSISFLVLLLEIRFGCIGYFVIADRTVEADFIVELDYIAVASPVLEIVLGYTVVNFVSPEYSVEYFGY